MDSKNSTKRRHYLISYRFQLRLTLRILILLIFTSLVIGWTTYYEVWTATDTQLEILQEQGRIQESELQEFQTALRSSLGMKTVLRFCLIIFIAVVFTIFATHRLVGPIRNMGNALESALRGEPATPIRLRRTDEFQDFAKLLNEVLETRLYTSQHTTGPKTDS